MRQLTRKRFEEINGKLQASATETRDIYHGEFGPPFDLAKLYDLPRPFEFHGYLRSGYGMNGEGGKMEAFKAPGAFAKYRLGNEAETYGEMALTNNWLREDDPLSAPYIRTTVMMSYNTGENFTFDSLNNQKQGNDIALRQAFVEGGNIFQSYPRYPGLGRPALLPAHGYSYQRLLLPRHERLWRRDTRRAARELQ